MGEPKDTWAERVRLLTPYQINRAAMDLHAIKAVLVATLGSA